MTVWVAEGASEWPDSEALVSGDMHFVMAMPSIEEWADTHIPTAPQKPSAVVEDFDAIRKRMLEIEAEKEHIRQIRALYGDHMLRPAPPPTPPRTGRTIAESMDSYPPWFPGQR